MRDVSFFHRDTWGKRMSKGLFDISLDFHQGELTCLIGPNGSGKSSIIRLCMEFAFPTSGTIERSNGLKTAYISDGGRSLYGTMNLEGNVRYAFALRGLPFTKNEKEKMKELSDAFGLIECRTAVFAMSRGMRQKASIISALMIPHDCMLADEPTLGLDFESQSVFEDIMRQRSAEGIGVAIATNDVAMAQRLTPRRLGVSNGRLIGADKDV
jgi:ABC-type multidrug transport system ATPase subunit